jgi:hypothetical protein
MVFFRRLRSHWAKREAKAAAIAFGIFAPLSFIVATFLSPITGGYTEMLVGRRFFDLVGAFLGVAVITALLSKVNFPANAAAIKLRVGILAQRRSSK